MEKVFVESHSILSGLGNTSLQNFKQLKQGKSAVKKQHKNTIDDSPFFASLVENDKYFVNDINTSRFEKFLITSIQSALQTSSIDIQDKQTLIVVSTTKGSISLLEEENYSKEMYERLSLHHSAKVAASFFKNPNTPVVISNACVSGLYALIYAKRLLQNGLYKNIVVVGADTFSRFVFSGFKSFQALSKETCAPFSLNRDGINLGEAAATIILTTSENSIELLGGASTNDANHISGPSRTGNELSMAINSALKLSNISAIAVDFISAHGTATLYNDEMEAKAFALANLQNTPLNSLKGYFGHTLGAAGLVELIISMLSLQEGIILPSAGFKELGVSVPINVCTENTYKKMRYCLKTASGFGGCNSALVISRN